VNLRDKLRDADLTVSWTPNGYADAVTKVGKEDLFVMPHEEVRKESQCYDSQVDFRE